MSPPAVRGAVLLRFAPFALGALLVAGIVHVATILLIPRVSTRNAAQRLSAEAAPNALATLPPVLGPADRLPLPFADPAAVAALCRFDLDEGPVRLRVPTSEGFLSVVVLSPTGRVLLSLTDRAATRRLLNIVLATAEQQRQLESQDPDDEPVQDLRLRLTEPKGVVVIRALALRDAEKRPAAALLARASCRPE